MATINRVDEISLNEKIITYNLGYKQLDSILNGIREGNVITIGGRPAMGKSMFINNIVLNILEKYNLPTLFVNLEAGKENVLLKLATTLSKRSIYGVSKDEALAKECRDKLLSKKYNLYISDDCYSIEDLEKVIEENQGIKFLIIDYVQLVSCCKSFASRIDSINDVLDRIKILANKYKLVVFLVSQLSRSVERGDCRPMLHSLSASGNLEYISDVVILLYRESYYKSEIKSNALEIIVAKNRYGSVGTVYLEYDKETLNLIDY